MFEAQIMDPLMQEMIKDGRIQNVSIGTMLEDLKEDTEAGTVTAIGMEGLEISLVAVPGDAGAGLTQALSESLKLKKDEILLTKLKTEEVMETEVEQTSIKDETTALEAPVEKTEATVEKTSDAEEKLKVANAELAEYKAKEANEKFKLAVAEEVKKQLEASEPPVEETPASDKPEDETTGTVGAEDSEDNEAEESFVVERAESGKGFDLYRNYTGEGAVKFKRLCRD